MTIKTTSIDDRKLAVLGRHGFRHDEDTGDWYRIGANMTARMSVDTIAEHRIDEFVELVETIVLRQEGTELQ